MGANGWTEARDTQKREKSILEEILWFATRNATGEAMLDFAATYNLVVPNTCFKTRDEHIIIFKSGPNMSQIDFLQEVLIWAKLISF